MCSWATHFIRTIVLHPIFCSDDHWKQTLSEENIIYMTELFHPFTHFFVLITFQLLTSDHSYFWWSWDRSTIILMKYIAQEITKLSMWVISDLLWENELLIMFLSTNLVVFFKDKHNTSSSLLYWKHFTIQILKNTAFYKMFILDHFIYLISDCFIKTS